MSTPSAKIAGGTFMMFSHLKIHPHSQAEARECMEKITYFLNSHISIAGGIK